MPNGSPVFSSSGKRSVWTSSRYRRYRSKGIGDAPSTSKFAKIAPKGKIEKMSEPVQVYTACQFVTPIIYGQNYSQVGNKKLIHLHLNWVEVSNPTSAQLEQKLIYTCVQVGYKLYCAKKTGKQGKVIALCSFLHFLLRLNLQNDLSGKTTWYPLNNICDIGYTIL